MSSKNQKLSNVLNTFLNILDETGNKSKIKFYFLIFLTLLTSIIEIIGVGILFPIFDVFHYFFLLTRMLTTMYT